MLHSVMLKKTKTKQNYKTCLYHVLYSNRTFIYLFIYTEELGLLIQPEGYVESHCYTIHARILPNLHLLWKKYLRLFIFIYYLL